MTRRFASSTLVAMAFAGVLAPAGSRLAASGELPGTQGPRKGVSCRTYPTSVVNTTVSRSSTVTLTYSGSYDTATHQTTYRVRYADTAGPSFSYVQVSTYRSTADFVDEVQVVPPLTLSTTTTATGGVSFALTNQYDGQGRLSGVINRSSGATITTRYTAWDGAGRPTAGSISTNGPVTITYDDASRTATTTMAIGTQDQSYDADGNPSKLVQTYGGNTSTTTTSVRATEEVCK